MSAQGDSDRDATRRYEFGQALRERRLELGMKQQDLARQVGRSVSWVSQIESGDLEASPETLARLGLALGDEPLASLDLPGIKEAELDSAGLTCLWRARAELLAQMAPTAPSQKQRIRLKQLARDIESIAASHPATQRFVENGRLLPLADIAASLPVGVRRLVLAELGGCKVDAPFEIEGVDDGEQRFDCLEFLLHDLALMDGVDTGDDPQEELRDHLVDLVQERRPCQRPAWPETKSVGGAASLLLAEQRDTLTLLGHDPAPWLGFRYVAGSWLIRDVEIRGPGAGLAVTETVDAPSPSGTGFAAGVAVAALLAPFTGGITAGLIGLALGAAAAGATDENNRSEVQRHSASATEAVESRRAAAAVEVAINLGVEWTRIEINKVVSLYRLFPDLQTSGDQALGLPTAAQAAARFARLVSVSVERKNSEETEAGRTGLYDLLHHLSLAFMEGHSAMRSVAQIDPSS